MDPLSMATGVGSVLLGLVIGRNMRPKPPPPPPPPPGPVCTCGHGYGTHEEAGACRAEVQRGTRWNSSGSYPVDFDWVPCPCLSYDGPEPMPRVWAP